MAVTLNDLIGKWSRTRRRKVEARAKELIAEEMSLRDLRRARRLTQRRMAESLRIGQDGVSRLEKRSDLLLSTLGSYVAAMGGRLRLVAEFPDRPPVILSGIAERDGPRPMRSKRARGKGARRGRTG
jgi:hypothetical protein